METWTDAHEGAGHLPLGPWGSQKRGNIGPIGHSVHLAIRVVLSVLLYNPTGSLFVII